MSEWIDCKDRLPEIEPGKTTSESVLIYAPCEGVAMEAFLYHFINKLQWRTGGPDYELDEVSHWMPLPDPPRPEG